MVASVPMSFAEAREDLPWLRFRLRHDKCIQGIHFLALTRPGITQFYIGKVFFFADREHFLDWGRPISGDRYVAMEHGPIPSTIYDLIKDTSGEPDELVDALTERVVIERAGNKLHVFPKRDDDNFPALSETDKEYLLDALQTYGTMPLAKLKELSHLDPAYEAAWSRPGLNNEMNWQLWLKDLGDENAILESLMESSVVDRPQAQQS
jgi:uncharacterized phage-associated protein